MRKCPTCGQYRGHVECLRGDEATECEDCIKTSHRGQATGNCSGGTTTTTSPPMQASLSKKHQVKIKVPVLVLHRVTTTSHISSSNNCNRQ